MRIFLGNKRLFDTLKEAKNYIYFYVPECVNPKIVKVKNGYAIEVDKEYSAK